MDQQDFDGIDKSAREADRNALDVFPLSPAQLGMWYAQHLDPEVPINIAQYVDLVGDLDTAALDRASAAAAREFGSGYLRIIEQGAEPVQTIDYSLDTRLKQVDVRGEADPVAAAVEWMRAEYSAPIDLVEGRLIVQAAIHVEDHRWFWYSRVHHVALDGYGATTFMNRIAEHYSAEAAGVEAEPSKAGDLRALYEQELAYRDSTRFQNDKVYWAERVAGLEEGTSLTGRTAAPAPVNGIVSAAMSAEEGSLLARSVAKHDSSQATLLIAAVGAYLAQINGTTDVILSLPVTARTTAVMRRSGGMVSNVVPLRLRVDYSTTVTDLLKSIAVEVSGALRHQRYRHEDIRRDSPTQNSTKEFFGPWVNIMLFHSELAFGPMTGQLHVLSTGAIEDLGVNLYQSVAGARAHIDFETNPNLYTEDEAKLHHARFLDFFERFLAAEPSDAVWSLDVTSEHERTLSVEGWNDTFRDVPDTTLTELLGEQRTLTPDNEAVEFEGAGLTYAEFDARVNRLARHLIAAGVGPESLVALGMRRSLDLVVGMHAVLAAGGAYVPIDPDHPAERTSYILDSSKPVCVLTTSYDDVDLPAGVAILHIDTLALDDVDPAPITAADRLSPLAPGNTAYVIYTSGSTGRPKGVAVTHHAIVNQMAWMLAEYDITAADVYFQKTATTFDVSLWGYFLPLLVGAKLIVATPDGHRDAAYVAAEIEKHGATLTDFVPSMLTVFALEATVEQCATLRHVFVIGEALPPETAAAFRAISPAGLQNLYGPTEAAVSVTYWQCTEADTVTVPIGMQEWNVRAYVLDSRLRPAAVGAAGELYLAGRQLARGYLGRPDLTSDRFVADPLGEPGTRMYRTGDLVRWRADGMLEYIGRTDFQVKFRGQRIELGEIETALLAHQTVSQAVVLVADTATGQQLVSYVVARQGQSIDPTELSRSVAVRLPSYMVPASVMVLDALPLNTSGKLDRKALPEPVFGGDADRFRAPRTQAEQIVAGVFADVLGVSRIGIDDSFFDLGGNSLVATQVVSRIGAAFGISLGVRALFETPTVAGLAIRAQAADKLDADRPALIARPRPDRIPLSPAQQRMWFLNQFDPTVPTYNLPFVVRLRGAVNVDALQTALVDVIERQESLRTLFPESSDGGYQQVLPMSEIDLGIAVVSIPEQQLQQRLAEFGAVGFDVSQELPIRIRIYELASDDYAIAIVLHHIAADGFSFGPFARDVATAYTAHALGVAPTWQRLPVQYADYTLWQRDLLGSEDDADSIASRQIAYWKQQLAGLPDQLDLPSDRPRPSVQTFEGGRTAFMISADLHRRLTDLARAHGVSLFMVMHSALAVLMSRLSGTTDIALGTPIAGRGEQALDDLIGMFVNTLVLRTEIDSDEAFADLLVRVRDIDLNGFAHSAVPFERLVEALNPVRSRSRHPLFQVVLSFQEEAPNSLELPDLSVVASEVEVDLAKFDMQWSLSEIHTAAGEPDGIEGGVSFATDLFDAATVAVFGQRFLRILAVVAADPSLSVRDIDILGADERASLVARTGAPAESARPLPELLADAVALSPDGVAVAFDDRTITYRELDERSSQLARVLIERGAGPESLVAAGITRSIESVLAAWAITKSGAAFVPVDPNYPMDRITHMLVDSGATIGLTVSELRPDLPDAVEWLVIDSPDFGRTVDAQSAEPVWDADRLRPLHVEQPAYMIYTSGSTGVPKGVVVTHRGLANFSAEQRERYATTAQSRTLHFASPSFDASVLELLLAIGAGATMVIVPPSIYGGAELATLLRRERVTHGFVTPAALASVDPSGLDDFRAVVAGGEAVPADLVSRWAPGREFFNGYGPTETTIMTNISEPLERGALVTIGGPIRGMSAFVLDTRLKPVPVGVAGELYLSGLQLARGYHRRPGLTAERFVADPFTGTGGRLYRTGDVVRWTADGSVEYVGRSDFQVKVRGFRIELGEIDAALSAYPDVDFATTVARDSAAGSTVLVSYVTQASGAELDIDELSDFVGRTLPSHMVPSSIMVIDEIPLTPVGKLDRKALPAPVFEVREFRAPTTPIEEIVAEIIGDVLGVARVGVDDDFFELGGNSLIATQVVSRLGTALDARVPVRMLFEAPTVGALAARVESHAGDGGRAALVPRDRPERIPLSLAQQRMWFLNRFDTESAVNNIPIAIRLTGELDVAALQVAVIDVIDRHESLRTVFPDSTDGPQQVVLDAAQIVPDLTPIATTNENLVQHLIALASVAFDVTDEVPLHASLFEIDETEYVLGMVVHHISADGWSMGPLARDVMVAYAARTTWEAPAWSVLPVQYADYALWQREVLGSEDDPTSLISQQVQFWSDKLAGVPDQLDLPSDRPRPVIATYQGGVFEFSISDTMQRDLMDLAHAHNASLFMVMHAALGVLLSRLSGTSDIAIGTPVAGRGEQALDELIGMFVNTLVLRTQVEPDASFVELLAQARETDLAAFGHADVPFERLVDVLNPARSRARHPLFQVMLTFQNTGQVSLELPGLSVAGVEFDAHLAKFDLQLTLSEIAGQNGQPAGLAAEFSYATDLFDESTVASFADRFVRVLDEVLLDATVAAGDIELLDAAERHLVLSEWNSTAHEVDPAATLASMFDAALGEHATATALSFEGATLTYAEFAERVNTLARHLISIGVGPESLVALGMRRSLDLVVGMYAVTVAGGGYVPLDPDHPIERKTYILETAQPVCVLTTASDDFAVAGAIRIDELDLSDYAAEPIAASERTAALAPTNTAYVIFTSGSTGRPKGVAVSHAAIVNRLVWMQAAYQLTAADVVLQKTPATFDVSVWEFFWPLQIGAKLVVARPDGHRDPAYLVDVIAEESVTTAHFVPSMMAVFVAHEGHGESSLRLVFASGEALPASTAQSLRELTGAALHNLYGPTEAAVDVTYHEVVDTDDLSVPIGAPVFNTAVYVLDSRLRPVPVGVAGELYLAGVQLARGYVARPDLTADRFVANPYAATPGARMYRTGDLVAWTDAGELEYIGRTDFQVKLRGLRIELGEIEAALTALDSIGQAVAMVRGDARMGDQLVAYLVATNGGIDLDTVRSALAHALPSYMVPSAFVVLDALPLNASGKLDRKALPAPVFEAKVFRAPTTPIEEIVANTFAEVLGSERVGLDDDFFELGGNSLVATQVVARLSAALDAQIGVRELFEAPTVASLAARAESHAGHGARAALVPQERPAKIPLSLAQQRMWFLNRFDTASAVNNIPVALKLSGSLDVDALQAAVGDVIARHETLHTVYPDSADGPHQVLVPVASAVPDLTPVATDATELHSAVLAFVMRGFDVTVDVPVRAQLLQTAADEYVLAIVVHHISADGFSVGPFTRDLMVAYASRSQGEPPVWEPHPVQYADFALWQRKVLGSEDNPTSLISSQLGYWRDALAGIPDQLDLPTDRPRPATASDRGAVYEFTISPRLHQALSTIAREQHSTVFMAVHSVFTVLLARLSGTDDIAIGTPVAGRGDAALDDLIGMFVNTLVLRAEYDPAASFTDLLAAVREVDLAAFGHADVPFERLVEVLNPARSQARHPLFQVMLAFQNQHRPHLELDGLTVSGLPAGDELAKFDLQLTLLDQYDEDGKPGEITALFGYATDLFDESTVASFADRFVGLLEAITSAPDVAVGSIDLLDPAERDLVLVEWNDTAQDLDPSTTVVELFAAQVAATPDAVAVSFDGGELTYAEFAARVHRVARLLISQGVGPETLVGLGMRRSVELVVAMYAVLEAGGAYVPLDPDHPAERVAHILDTADPICVLTTGADDFVAPLPAYVIDLTTVDLTTFADTPIAAGERLAQPRPDNAAYVLFTSGSTGRPKGVTVSRAAVANQVQWIVDRFAIGAADVVLFKTPATFDVSVWELYGPLVTGATMVIATANGHRDPEYLAETIAAHGVTLTSFVPSMLSVFAGTVEAGSLPSLRALLVAGEALPRETVAATRQLTDAALHNLYGPTEFTVHATECVLEGELPTNVPIGSPVWNAQALILDARLQLSPAGVPGELYLAGTQLARGYAQRADLTSDRFVANPFGDPGARMYRTGDLVRWNADGVIEYLGRTDFQVKLRGLRIELGEIESALLSHSSVTQAVALLHSDPHTGEQLVAYVVPAPGSAPDAADLRSVVAQQLPSYMVPAAFVTLDALPLNASGKLDRRALPAPLFVAKAFRAPANPVEEIVAEVFAEVLGLVRVGRDDDFFELGGNSLIATQVASRIGAALDTQVPVRVLFEASTVAALAARTESHAGEGRRAPLVARERPALIPLSLAQQRMWFLNRFDTQSGANNIPFAVRLSGELDVVAFSAAINDVIGRHESLRTVYPEIDGVGYQVVRPHREIEFDLVIEEVHADELVDRVAALANESFDVTTELPFRARLLQLDDTEYVVTLVLHHISSDGFSVGPMMRDVMGAYAARTQGEAPGWKALDVQYVDYTLWQREVLGTEDDPKSLISKQIDYWSTTLADLPELLELPADRVRPEVATNRGRTLGFTIDAELADALSELARTHGASLFMVLHSALALWAARMSGTTDIAIGTPVAGRGEQALDDIIGMFVNTLVLRTEVDGSAGFVDLLATSRDTDLGAFGHADVPFERLVEVLDPARSQAHHPLFQLMFTYQNAFEGTFALAGIDAEIVEFDTGTAKFDLQLTIGEAATVAGRTELSGHFTYATDLFDDSTVAGFAERFVRLLRGVVAEPTHAVGDIDTLDAIERDQVLHLWNSSGPDTGADTTLVALFDNAAAAHPDSVAVRYENSALTYRELDARANQLARVLIDAGVGPESLVAVSLPRSLDLVVALLAVVKAGGGYLPVDPTYPADRIEYMLLDAAPVCVVAASDREIALPAALPVLEIDTLDVSGVSTTPITDAERTAPLLSSHIAYVIYTSGSTGRPKGVLVPHRNVVKLFANTQSAFGFDHNDVWTMFHSYAFDFSVWELWGPLLYGGTLVVVDYYTSRSPEQFHELLERERVTVLNQTPSAFYQLAEVDRRSTAELSLRYVVFGGEALELRRLTDWYGRHADNAPRLVNMYGITETTVHVSHRELDAATASAATSSIVGRAIAGLEVFVLDTRLRPVPVGVPGEMYVAGVQLARGYLGQPALTAGRFVASPFGEAGTALYRTGDLARWNRSGELEYLGRADDQVKVRGFRIELGEIEAALLAQDSVAQVAVIVREDAPGDQRLVAYAVAAPSVAIDVETVRDDVADLLPAYMVPSAIVVLDSIPLTANGKLDRKSLPAPAAEGRAFRAPTTPVEEVVAGVFADVIGIDRVGRDDDFFDLGGNSLIATRVVSRIGAALGTVVPVRTLFEASTVAAMAARVESHSGEARRALTAGPRPDLIPLSFAQQRMWFLNKYDTTSAAYNVPIAIRLEGELDVDALRIAIADVIRRHESLRTRYPEHGGTPYQVIVAAEQAIPELAPIDVTADGLLGAVMDFMSDGFDVSEHAPIRARIFRTSPVEHVLAVVVHHISADGFSMGPLTRDVMTAYVARTEGEAPSWSPLEVQYADYAIWQREVLGSEDDAQSLISKQIAYWDSALAGIPDQLDLPADRPRPSIATNAGRTSTFTIDADLLAGLNRVAREQNSSLFMVVHGALAVLLARLSGTDDIVIGTPVAGRGDAALDDLVGMFVNTLVLRTPIDATESFADLIARVRQVDLDAFGHADVPFERLVDVLDPERSQARHPLFQVALAFQNLDRAALELPGLRVDALDIEDQVARFDLQLTLSEIGGGADGMAGAITYATDLFDESTIALFAQRWLRVLGAVAADPAVSVAQIDVLDEAERADLVTRAGGATVEPRTLADLLAAAAALDPARTAVVFEGEETTYRELDERSNRLARLLIDRGVGPEDLVALGIKRSTESVLASWAVAKTGAAFVPIDPNYPADRIEHMVTDSGAKVGLTVASARGDLSESVEWLLLDDPALLEQASATSAEPVTAVDRVRTLRTDHPAFVIYTSGSTGKPKGVVVTHSGLANFSAEQVERYSITPESRALHFASPSFDASMLELLLAVGAGATLVVAPPTIYGGDELADLLRRTHVTHAFITPAALASVDPTGIDDLRVVVAGGEACPPELVSRWAATDAAGKREFFNGYGPTETTIMTNISAPLLVGETVTIGGPIRGMRSLVLDSRLRPVPVGVAGELYLSGVQLARGYHARPGLSAERFVANPYGDATDDAGARMYRTGDVVRWTSDRTVEYVGRSDFQVKVRGFRIELGEIDAALAADETVDFATTVGHKSSTGAVSLVSYVVATPGNSIDVAALSAAVGERLPSYMVPASIMVLDRIPLTPVGKLDRAALPEPVFAADVAFRAPRTPVEQTIADIFAEVLGLDRVGVDDSFFALGGDSIVSIQLVSRAKARGVIFSPRHVFEQRTVAGLASVAEVADPSSAAPVTLAELPGGGVGTMPLPPVVRFMAERGGSFDRFNQTLVLELPIGIDRANVVATVAAVIDRHDMLRSKLHRDDAGEWQLEVLPAGAVDADSLVTRTEFDPSIDADAFTDLATDALDSALGSLDPANGVVVQFGWLDPSAHDGAAPRSGRLIVAAHHLAVDGVSWRILVPDFVTAWAQLSSGQSPELAEPGTSMRRWAHALGERAVDEARVAELPMWRHIVDGPDPLVGPRALDPDIDLASVVRKVRVEVSAQVTKSLLTTVPALYHGGVNDALLAALALAVTKWRARRGVHENSALIRLEGHGREEEVVPGADLSRTVGWFTAIFPVRFDIGGVDVDDAFAGGPAMGSAIKAAKEALLSVPDKGIGYGLLRYLNNDAAAELPVRLPGQVSFNYLGQISASDIPEQLAGFGWIPAADLGDLVAQPDADMPAMAPLDINAIVVGGTLSANFGYPETLLDRADVDELAHLWVEALEAVARHAGSAEAGGRTPSDLTLVDVTQGDIEKWEHRYPALTDAWPLSPLQAGLMFHALLAVTSVDVYTSQIVLSLSGSVDGRRLRSAAEAMLDRYANLRTAFVTDVAGNAVQVVLETVETPWTDFDLVRLDDADRAVEFERILADDRAARFDLTQPPLIRFTLVRVESDKWQLIVTNHHILLDGWSMPLLMKDLLVLYAVRGDSSMLPPVRAYRTFLEWVSVQDKAASEQAWQQALAGVSEPTLLAPMDSSRQITALAGEYLFELDEQQTAKLSGFAAELGVTANTVLQTAWGILLARITGRDDVVFGTTVSGRPADLSGVESMVGLFINTVPVRVRFDAAETASAVLTRIQGEQADLLDHHYVGLADIQAAAGVGGLFDTLVVFESYPVDAAGISAQAAAIDGMSVDGIDANDATHYPLTLIAQLDTKLRIRAGYLRDLFDDNAVRAIADRLVRVIDSITATPAAAVGDIELLDAAERKLVVEEWNSTAYEVDSSATLVSMFEAAVV
ncbi:non-ribosomal peptide synthase/polyketide synthase, partial [Antrihabitans spumae]